MNSVVGGGIAVPQDWTPMRLSRGLIAMQDGTHGSFDRVPDGVPLLSAKNVRNEGLKVDETESLIAADDSASITANGFPKFGDVLLTIVGTVGRSTVYLEKGRLAFQRSVCFLRPDPLIDSHFLNYFLQSRYFQDQLTARSKSAAQAGVYLGDVAACAILRPPLDEQRQIAEYLDRETGKIDELIAKQEQLVVTLTERRQAEIYFAVTKGLDIHVSRKSSCVLWAGDIPSHWTVPRVAHGFMTLLGKMVNEGRTESGAVIEAPYLRAGNVQPYGLDITEVKRMPFSEAELRSLAILRGDLIVVEGGQGGYGRSAIAESDLRGWAFQNHVMRVRPTGMDRNRFLDYILKAMRASGFIASLSSHASLPSFSADKLKSTRYPRPPVNEQDKIVDYLDSTTVLIDQIVAKSAETIALLRERRAALISAAVTGKIDVRELT